MALENARLDLKLTLTTGAAHISSVHKIIETPKSESPPFEKTICGLFVDIYLRFAMAMVLWANWWPSAARKVSPNFCWKQKPPTPPRSDRGGRVCRGEFPTRLSRNRYRGKQRTAAGAFRELCRSRAQEVC